MHEKELRLALVCYGGVSLAIYMSGVTKEVLKVVRASKQYHSLVDPKVRHGARYADTPHPNYETDTEHLYFELLQAHAPELELRVIVDILSGASAGGINAVFLARALAHDLSLDDHRTMWLHNADVTELMEPDTIADRWSKFYLYPFFWAMNSQRLKAMIPNDETRHKLSIFVRSRWFKPPFSGRRMLLWMLEACTAMSESIRPGEPDEAGGVSAGPPTLVPPGQRLDLYVSLTNFHGRQETIELHDPGSITEREHRTSLTFTYLRRESGFVASDFGDDNVPGLAFAARATSSFPGAFPPAQLKDLETMLGERALDWPKRDRFLRANFPPETRHGDRVSDISFIDGSVVNNKPFAEAIEALGDRPAHREVDRRIVYIDPVPESFEEGEREAPPGFFRSIFASLSDIPRNEPINDELQWINTHNRESRRLHAVITSVKAEVDGIIDGLIKEGDTGVPSVALLASWRDSINVMAKERAGYTYTGYSHTKTFAIFESLATLICMLCEAGGVSSTRQTVLEIIHDWAHYRAILPELEEADVIAAAPRQGVDTHALIQFLRQFDVDFRIRRLRFVISSLNEIYHSPAARHSAAFDPHQLNTIKRELYIFIDQLKDRWLAPAYIENARSETAAFAETLETGGKAALDALEPLLAKLAALMELEERDLLFDTKMSEHIGGIGDPRVRQELFRVYIGFPFFDVLTLPLVQSNDMSELEPIRVDRISPEDCNDIRSGGADAVLKGIGFARFGAFFSRTDRENDYLWGRLNGAERMVDFVVSAGEDADGISGLDPSFDLVDFKKRLFLSILDAEEGHLPHSTALLKELRQEIENL